MCEVNRVDWGRVGNGDEFLRYVQPANRRACVMAMIVEFGEDGEYRVIAGPLPLDEAMATALHWNVQDEWAADIVAERDAAGGTGLTPRSSRKAVLPITVKWQDLPGGCCVESLEAPSRPKRRAARRRAASV